MAELVRDLGTIGAVGGLHLLAGVYGLTLYREGAAWNLSGYTTPTYALKIRALGSGTTVTPNGTIVVVSATAGTISYTPGTADPIHAASGPYEARVWVTPSGGKTVPSDLFRFDIAEGPAST